MNTKGIGNIGEAYALAKLVELGIPVYQQFGDNEPVDYIILVNNKPIKIQVKSSETYDENTITFSLVSSTSHRKHKYTKEEVDAFICYNVKNKDLFIIPNEGQMTGVIIRYTDPKNGQTKGIRFANKYFLCVETLYEIAKNIG